MLITLRAYTTSLEFKFLLQFPCGSSSTELSNFRQSAQRGNEHEINVNKHWKTHAKGNDALLRSSPPNKSISHRLFRCRHSNSRDAVASSPFYSHPSARRRPGELARRLDIYIMSFLLCSLSATQYSSQHLPLYIFNLPRFNFTLGADFTFLCVCILTCNKQKTKSTYAG